MVITSKHILIGIIFFIIGALLAIVSYEKDGANTIGVQINELPEFIVFDLNNNGNSIKRILSNNKYNILMINSLTCSVCIDQGLILRSLYNEYSDEYFFMGIFIESNSNEIDNFIRRTDIPFDIYSADRNLVRSLRLYDWPIVIISDSSGQIKFIKSGSDALNGLTDYLKK